MKKEEKYYIPIKIKIEELLSNRVNNFQIEITANKKFSNHLKAEIRPERDIIFNFLKEAPPDITGFIKGEYSSDFIVIEFKEKKIKLDDIYQTKKYRDLFNAKFVFLISLEPIPEEIKRLHRATYELLSMPHYSQAFTLAQFDEKTGNFIEWYPENPFERETCWK